MSAENFGLKVVFFLFNRTASSHVPIVKTRDELILCYNELTMRVL